MLFPVLPRNVFSLLLLFFAWQMQASVAPPTLQIPQAAQAGPGFNAETATRAYLATLPPDKKARSDAYFEGGYWLILWDFVYGAAISIFLLATRFTLRMRVLAERLTRRKALQTWLYWGQYILVLFVLGLPWAIYEGYFREHQYELSNQTFGAWFGDELKQLALAIILGGLAVIALFAIARRLPRTWHIWGAATAIVFLMVGMLIGPVFIAPLFNKYTVLTNARQNGIPATNVYEVDASRQSKRVSANVSGFLGTERITLNDNLLNRCSPEAVFAVMGHEMGHYVLNHIFKMLGSFVLILLLMFAALRWALDWSLARWGERWGITGIGDLAIVPLVALVLSTFTLLITPVINTLVRTQEYEADIFGLNTSRQPDGFAKAALVLSEYRKLDPGPWEEILFFDHPSGRTRIYSAMRWKAENQ